MNCCWYSDQNAALAMNIGMNESTRRRSTEVIFRLLRITTKFPTAATATTQTTTLDRFAAVTRPVSSTTTSTATTSTPTPATGTRFDAGNGFGTTEAASGRFLRPNAYWIRPSAMPIAASPKPRWKPTSLCASPVSSGPTSPPMFTPM